MITKNISSRTIRGVATLMGTIFGAGVFGVPYVISRVGILVGVFYLLFIVGIVLATHLAYAEVVLGIRTKHRLAGFTNELLGRGWSAFAGILNVFGNWLAVAAYIILGGTFLFTLLGSWFGGSIATWGLLFFAVAIGIASAGLRWVSRVEVPLALGLVVLFVVVAVMALPHVIVPNLGIVILDSPFVPYGVLLFALSGFSVIPELEDIVGNGNRHLLRRVIIIGTLVAAVVTAFFGISIAGVTGSQTTQNGITGLIPILGRGVVIVGAITGLFAVLSSCISVLTNQIDVFTIDHSASRVIAWVSAVLIPLFFFGVGGQNFIRVIGLAGGLMSGTTAALIMMLVLVILHRRHASWPHLVLPYFVGAVFLGGAALELVQFLHV